MSDWTIKMLQSQVATLERLLNIQEKVALEKSVESDQQIELLDTLLQHSPNALVVIDHTNQVAFANDVLSQHYNWHTHQDFTQLSRSWRWFEDEDERTRIDTSVLFRDVAFNDIFWDGQFGLWVLVNWSPMPNHKRYTGVLSLEDVTEEQRALQQANREALIRLLQQTTQTLNVSAYTVSLETDDISTLNIDGLSNQTFTMTPQWWQSHRADLISQSRASMCSDCHTHQFDGQCFVQDGDKHYKLHLSGHAHLLPGTEGAHLLLIEDVTQSMETQRLLEHLNEELVISQEQARVASQAKSAFLASMSHELRTPLNAIIGYSEMLFEDWSMQGGEDESLRDLANINKAGHLLKALIDDILDLAKIESGHMTVVRQKTFLPDICHELDATIQPLLSKQTSFQWQMSQQMPAYIHTDALKLRQCLLNLLSNAAKFTNQGVIELSFDQPDPNHVTCVVRDTGVGIASEHIQHIFDSFVQAPQTSKSQKTKSTGLGLAITKQLIELLGGQLHVESQLGQGSTFWFDLPLL